MRLIQNARNIGREIEFRPRRDRATAQHSAAPTDPSERSKAVNAWAAQIRTKIHANAVLPRAVEGSPEVSFIVKLRPTGEVLAVTLQHSSGQKDFDSAVQRAILKSSPLPTPRAEGIFDPMIEIRYRAY